jgi:membrane-associated phospholipid phosphatase
MGVRWGRPLLGDARRPWAGLAVAACVIVVVTLGLLVRGQTGPDGFDDAVDTPVIAFFGGHHGLLLWLALPATFVPATAISAATAVGCLIARRLNGVVLAVTAVPVAAVLDDALLKHLFDRTYLGQLAFPSGHTTSVTAQTALLAVILLVPPQRQRTRTARVALVTAYCVITATVAVAVIALRWHYFTDTVAGAATGAGTVLVLALLIDLALVIPVPGWAGHPADLRTQAGHDDGGFLDEGTRRMCSIVVRSASRSSSSDKLANSGRYPGIEDKATKASRSVAVGLSPKIRVRARWRIESGPSSSFSRLAAGSTDVRAYCRLSTKKSTKPFTRYSTRARRARIAAASSSIVMSRSTPD